MKTIKYFSVILFVAAIFMLIGCSTDDVEDNKLHPNTTPAPMEMYLNLVKFKDINYHQYVIVDSLGDYFKMRGQSMVPQELFLGKNPYIALPDNWFLVDWKWGSFIYEPFSVLLSHPWGELPDRHQTFSVETTVMDTKPLTRWTGVSRRQVNNALGITPTPPPVGEENQYVDTLISPDYLRPLWSEKFQYLSELQSYITDSIDGYWSEEAFYREVAFQDSLQLVFVDRLTTLIETGELGKILPK